ncbi:MAG: VWA domain-containing protein [Bacteroidetes bacterium]|nr:VWA domain-containing protein [Bacteroidota bacterium]
MKRISTIAASLLLLISTSLFAQTEARVTTMHVVKGDPNGLFTISIRCNGEAQFDLTRSQLTITDNGSPVEDFNIVESSSPMVRNPISAALVMDASGSMSGSGNAGAKNAGHAFVDFMDGVVDEASVFFFTQVVTRYQQMTTVKPMLHVAVDALPASGATAVWDGIWEGLTELQSNGVNSKKAVVVLTDGGDNSSSRSPAQIIQLAQLYNLRVFTIGLGSGINATELQLIALLTGGAYFQTPNANDLQLIFTQIANFMGHGFEEHTVAFKTPDPDAVEHELQISVIACGETAASTFKEAAVTTTGVARAPHAAPFALELGQNVPNPFSPSGETLIPYTLSGINSPQPLRLEVFDLLGRCMAKLIDADVLPGSHFVRFDARGLAPGMYLYRLSSGSVTTTKTMIVR